MNTIDELLDKAAKELAMDSAHIPAIKSVLKPHFVKALSTQSATIEDLLEERDDIRKIALNDLHEAQKQIEWLEKQLERARTYKGIEGWPCPLCRFENGVFKESCEMHKQIDELERKCAAKDEALKKAKFALDWSRPIGGVSCDGEDISKDQVAEWHSEASEAIDKALSSPGQEVVRVEKFPSNQKNSLVEIFYLKSHEPFVCGVYGNVTSDQIRRIEADCMENMESLFNNGDGQYLFSCQWDNGQYDSSGRCEYPPYWDLTLKAFEPVKFDNDSHLTPNQQEKG